MQKISKTALGLAALAAVILIGVAAVWVYNANNVKAPEPAETVSQQTQTEPAQNKISFSQDGKIVAYQGEQGKTALEILKSLTEVETEESSIGEFVTTINGVKADGTTQFWAFYVNGKQAAEGAGTYKTSPDEKIEWRIEKIE
ncbi:DUF4430 domain-containing protein [Candidatus Parcubacteria bacterium]|nr:DUF4430 domain-containing protein [Candidatus Parcubacteria bacterium]